MFLSKYLILNVPVGAMNLKENRPLYITSGIAVVVLILFTWMSRWRGLTLSIDPGNVLSAMSPLLLTSAFIERAVEIVISPWRDAGATNLGNIVDTLKAQVPSADAKAIADAEASFHQYK